MAVLENLTKSTYEKLESRERLYKINISPKEKKSANRILKSYIKVNSTLAEITDVVYAIAKAVENQQGVKRKVNNGIRKKGNRRIRKLNKQIKELKQFVPKVSNEIYGRRIRRKETIKEKLILEDVKTELKIAKEIWLDKLRGKK